MSLCLVGAPRRLERRVYSYINTSSSNPPHTLTQETPHAIKHTDFNFTRKKAKCYLWCENPQCTSEGCVGRRPPWVISLRQQETRGQWGKKNLRVDCILICPDPLTSCRRLTRPPTTSAKCPRERSTTSPSCRWCSCWCCVRLACTRYRTWRWSSLCSWSC